jgi:K+-sensing histidine kinase KdpD
MVEMKPSSHYSALQGMLVGVVSLLLVGLIIFPFRHHDYEVEFLLVLPVVYAGVFGGRTAAVVIAVAAVGVFHLVVRFEKSGIQEDIVAFATFFGCAFAVGSVVGSKVDLLFLAEQRQQEQRRLAELDIQVAENAARMAVLEQVDQQRVALLRSVSHDLRTPLATIRAVATDLRDDDLHDRRVRQELLKSVSDEAERLDHLVGNLLSMSRIEAGSMRLDDQAVDLVEVMNLAALRLSPLFVDATLDVQIDPTLPLLDGDPMLLDEVISNLLENAARYAPSGTSVSVELTSTEGPTVLLRVRDHGPGIDPQHAEQAFQPFWRGPDSRSSGLGLAIVRAIVEAHHGTITLSPTPGGGATFDIHLPARDDAPIEQEVGAGSG